MKAVIVDASGSVAVALRDDGQFVKIKNLDFSIGQEIRIAPQKVSRFPKQAAIAASAALVLTGGAGVGLYEWNSPYSYVSLDASPSIEYALNRFDVVIAVNGLNDEGRQVANTIGDTVKNTKIDKALEITVAALSDENYISNSDASNVVVSVYSDSDSKVVELITTVNNVTNTTPGNVAVAAVAVDKDTHNQIEAGLIGDTPVVVDESTIAKDTETADNGNISPVKGEGADKTLADGSGAGVTDVAETGADTQKEKNNTNASGNDDKNKVNASSSAAIDKTDIKQNTDSSTNNSTDKTDKKNDNKNNKTEVTDNTDSGKNNESSNKTDSPAKTEESPSKGDTAPQKAEIEEVANEDISGEEPVLSECFSELVEM